MNIGTQILDRRSEIRILCQQSLHLLDYQVPKEMGKGVGKVLEVAVGDRTEAIVKFLEGVDLHIFDSQIIINIISKLI